MKTLLKQIKVAIIMAMLVLPGLAVNAQTCASGPATNTSCPGAALALGADCTQGIGATGGVWYSFVTDSTNTSYRISTDNQGIGTQSDGLVASIAVYSGACPGALVGSTTAAGSCSGNSTVFDVTGLTAGGVTYYIFVTASATSHFCINVNPLVVSANDCFAGAIDITTDFMDSTLSCSSPFISKAYTYYQTTPTTVKDSTGSTVRDTTCNGPNSLINGVKNDVWFKYTYTGGSTDDKWLNVYPNNGCNYYGLAAYKITAAGDPSTSTCSSVIGLTLIDCSLGDNAPLSCNSDGGSRNMSKQSAINHPRLDLSNLSSLGVNNGDVVYLRVWQYTQIDGDPTSPRFGLDALPTDAIFNLVAEAQPSGTTSIDGLTEDRCINGNPTIGLGCAGRWPATCADADVAVLPTAVDNLNYTKTCLTNAGLSGNVNNQSNCTIAAGCDNPRTDEPNGLQASGVYNECGGNVLTAGFCTNLNYSGYYKFTIPNVSVAVKVTDYPARALLCTAINLLVEPLRSILLAALCPPNITATSIPALGKTRITVSNIKTMGVNGNRLQAYVYKNGSDCTQAPILLFGEPNNCNNSVCFTAPSSVCGGLPSGCYSLVIDGVDGQLLSYDLNVAVTMVDPLTCLPVVTTTCNTNTRMGKTAPLKIDALELQSVKPVPTNDKVQVSYVSGSEGKMHVVVYDILGQIVYQDTYDTAIGENTHEINMTNFKAGVYMVNMEQNGVKLQTKIVKVD